MAKLVHSYHSRKDPLFVVQVDYDFTRDGGAAGDIDLGGAVPSGAVVLAGFLRVTTALTSGGAATGALKLEGAGDLTAAAVVAGPPWSTTGLKDLTLDGSGSTTVRTTDQRNVSLTVATADLTAGAFKVTLLCVESG